MPAITFYNNKGGVSKTTTLFNVAVYMSVELKKKVLLIDADSQCNLTELFFAPDDDFYLDTDYTLPGDSLLDVFQPRLDGASSKIDVEDIDIASSEIYQNLDIIRGDIEFSSIAEPYFGNAINQAITTNINEKNTYIAFRRLVKELLEKRGYDYVFVDLGPSSGAITQLVFLASDFFFVPITPDRFCYLGVKSLPKLLERWMEHDRLVLKTLKPYGIESDYSSPVFLGAINQNFQIHRSQIKESYLKWAKKIRTELRASLIKSTTIKSSELLLGKSDPYVCSIENIGQLAPVAQMLGKAIFDIKQEDTAYASSSGSMFYGTVWKVWEKKINSYRNEIARIASRIEAENG